MIPYYIATEVFDEHSEGWRKYVDWSGLNQLAELVSLDDLLCPSVLPDILDSYWPHIVNEDNFLSFFTDLDFMLDQIGDFTRVNVLAVLREPAEHSVRLGIGANFSFVGFDLLDQDNSISALSNCGGFPDVFSNFDINGLGLLDDFGKAREIRDALRRCHPGEHHANCNIWAVYRMVTGENASAMGTPK